MNHCCGPHTLAVTAAVFALTLCVDQAISCADYDGKGSLQNPTTLISSTGDDDDKSASWTWDDSKENRLGGGIFDFEEAHGGGELDFEKMFITIRSRNVKAFHQYSFTIDFVDSNDGYGHIEPKSYWLNSNDTCSAWTYYYPIKSVTVSVVQPPPHNRRPH